MTEDLYKSLYHVGYTLQASTARIRVSSPVARLVMICTISCLTNLKSTWALLELV